MEYKAKSGHSSKGGAPKDHWEIKYDPTERHAPKTPAGAFLPKCGYERPTPHLKVNETDH